MSLIDGHAATQVSTWVLRAHQKLPNDLSVDEYAELVSSLARLCEYADDQESSRIERAQYGSDFLTIIAVSSLAAATLVPLSIVVKNLSAARKSQADRHLSEAEAEATRDRASRAREDWLAAQDAVQVVSDVDVARAELLRAKARKLRAEAVSLAAEARYANETAEQVRRLTRLRELEFAERKQTSSNADARSVMRAMAEQLNATDPKRAGRLAEQADLQPGTVGDGQLHGLASAVEYLAAYEIALDVEG